MHDQTNIKLGIDDLYCVNLESGEIFRIFILAEFWIVLFWMYWCI